MFKKYRGYIIAFLAGVIATASTGAYAAVGDKVEAIFADFNLKVNGKYVNLTDTPVVINGSSYLPLRNVALLLGYDVSYKADSRTIELTNSEAPMKTGNEKDRPKIIRLSSLLLNGSIKYLV